MGSLSSELGFRVARHSPDPRVYADANLPMPLISFMRVRLGWDVFFVIEHDDLRRASDERHYALAREMRRTLVTLDRDYLDDRRFPPRESGGVLVISAPDDRRLRQVLQRVDARLLRLNEPADTAARRGTTSASQKSTSGASRASGSHATASSVAPAAGAGRGRALDMPLAGRKIEAHIDWP